MKKIMKLFVLSSVLFAAGAHADGGHGSTGKDTPKDSSRRVEGAGDGHGANGRSASEGGGVGGSRRSSGHGSNG